MNERMLAEEWVAMRRRSMRVLPMAVLIWAVLGGVVYFERLHESEAGFLSGTLFGITTFWVVLEVMTVVRVGRLLRTAT